MTGSTARTKAYLKHSCPHCLKFRIFVTEAGIADRFDFTVFEDGDATHEALRARMQAAGQEPSFPAVEAEAGRLSTGTDDLIDRYARGANVEPGRLPLFNYYLGGVFRRHVEMFRELKALKEGKSV